MAIHHPIRPANAARTTLRGAALLVLLASSALLAASPPVDFDRDVRPILARHCVECHGPETREAGLRLDRFAALREGGDSGSPIVAGNTAESLLLQAVTGAGDGTPMPPEGERLDAREIDVLKSWVEQGADGPDDEPDERQSDHWAFQPIVRPPVPAVEYAEWPRNEIDRFILARLERAGAAPSAEADRATLLRRLSFDLTGLPPAAADLDAAMTDADPLAYERVVDRLLASPHYGERWGRHWLDVVRYADSAGFEFDRPRSVWKYRDWVIDALNRDLPFDQFIAWQIAGDLLPQATHEQRAATTMNWLGMNEGAAEAQRLQVVVDQVNTLGAAFLGLTLGCAQCHSHKLEPITQREYYRLFAFFNDADEAVLEFAEPDELAARDALREKLAALEKELGEYDQTFVEKLPEHEAQLDDVARGQLPNNAQSILAIADGERTEAQRQSLLNSLQERDPQRQEMTAAIAEQKSKIPAFDSTFVMQPRTEPRATHVLLRGDFGNPGSPVSAGVPGVLPPLDGSSEPTRLDLARWLTSAGNPLTARVLVNRVWQRCFGVGLVETENDFGTQGAAPSHPELLDWLAADFMEHGWSLKRLHRQILTSSTYRQSSRARSELADVDPSNRLLARMSRTRLEAEAVRDAALSSAGLLNRKLGGPSVFPDQADGVMDGRAGRQTWTVSAGDDRLRRGMYTHYWRLTPHPFLELFDAPNAVDSCTRRQRSNTPLQSLTLLNDPLFVECAQALARRTLADAPPDDAERIAYAFRLCLARDPLPQERELLERFLAAKVAEFRADAPRAVAIVGPAIDPTSDAAVTAAWTELARVLFNTDEFITRQ